MGAGYIRKALSGLPLGAAWVMALAVFVPLCGALLAESALEVVLQREALAGVAGGFYAAALGAAGYVGQWSLLRLPVWPGPSGGLLAPGIWHPDGDGSVGAAGEDWPVLAMLLFAPIVILFSGLGGWV
ncbi:hypothetical protein RxyAA322_15300 [Rubrobacter xylanophilus]|uniref:Uncharacterized protein n=1 Tax=Rubrobacter xylanophilus TaxID=49319 RepID=A0A510HI46_9ACTN|nr:hypothetical protein [Rubrobacter xylanophilus]BBL79676.1 hypothetical protein RxyAA322_15300 [Rubrobacter xylanophilus]